VQDKDVFDGGFENDATARLVVMFIQAGMVIIWDVLPIVYVV